MKPVVPIIPGSDLPVTQYAKRQDEYLTLPAWKSKGARGGVLSRWRLSWKERLKLLCTGNMYLWVMTFDMPLQPVLLTINKPEVKVALGPSDVQWIPPGQGKASE